MLRAETLMAMLLVLVPVTGFPILSRLLVLWELWPEHVVKYQQISVADMKNGLYKTPLHVILDESTLKKFSSNYKNFGRNLETPWKNTERNHQQKNTLKDVLLYQRNLCLITGESTTVQVLGMHLRPSELILRGKNKLTNIAKNSLKNGKLDVYEVKKTVFRVKKKSENENMEQLKLIYFGNGHKYSETGLPLAITLPTKTMLKAEEAHLKIYQEDLENILVLMLVTQQQSRGRKRTVIRMLQKKKCKNSDGKILASGKEREFFRENANAYSKDQFRVFIDVKQILNDKRKGQHKEFTKYGQLSVNFQQKSNVLVREKMKVKKWKTAKQWVENQKFPLIHAYQRDNYNKQKILLAHQTILCHIKKSQHFTFKTSRNKKWSKKWSMVFRAKRKSKTRETEMEISSKFYYIQPSVIKHNFLAITTDKRIRGEIFSEEMNQTKSSVYMIEMLKCLMQLFQKVNKYFSVAQKGFRNSAPKALLERKHFGTENLQSMLHLHKHIFQDPSVERTKRSTKGENAQISEAVLKRLTSALVVCVTIFGMTFSVLSLAVCYLYYKRRQLEPFLDLLKGGESPHGSKPNDSKCCTPISLSQAFHFGHSQESNKNQTTMTTSSKTFPTEQKRSYTVESPCKIKRTTKFHSKEGSDDTIREVYASSDAEHSSNQSHGGFTVKSKAYLFPSWSSESTGSLCDDDVGDASSAQLSSSDEIIMENEFSDQSRSNTNQKEKASVSVAHYSCRNQDHSTSSDELFQIKKPRVSKSKSENDICTSSSKELRAVHSFTIFDGSHNP